MPILFTLFNANFYHSYYPKYFRKTFTISFKKLKKDDYSIAKFYRPIILLNIIEKALKLVIANRISKLTKKHFLLLKKHLNVKKAVLTDIAIHILIKRIYRV